MIDDEDTWHTVLPHGRKMNEKHKVEFRFLSINLMNFFGNRNTEQSNRYKKLFRK